MTCLAGLLAACSQKQAVVSVPVSHIDVEQLKDSIDYNMDVTGLPLSDLRVLRNAPAARLGYPFRDAYLRGIYSTTTWYDSLMWKFDEKLEEMDWSKVPEKENESWRDRYYRASEVTGLVKYSQEELDFMKRLKEREDELLKQNFEVPEGLRVNMQNLVNPTQLKEFDSLLCQRLGEMGFAIVPGTHDQLLAHDFLAHLVRHLFRHKGHARLVEAFCTSLFERHLEEIEEVVVAIQHVAFETLLAGIKHPIFQKHEAGNALNFGDLPLDDVFHGVGVDEFLRPHGVNPLTVRVLARHSELLHHIAEAQDDKGQGHAQTDELDGGKQLVSREEFQVASHDNQLKTSRG